MSVIFIYILQNVLMFRQCGVAAEHHLTGQPVETMAIEGTSVQLQCKVTITLNGNHTHSIRWQLNGETYIEETDSKYEIDHESNFEGQNGSLTSTLTIVDVTRKDKGLYSCDLYQDSSKLLPSSIRTKLTIISKPTFLREPRNLTAIEGHPATLRCKIVDVDNGEMFVKWTKDNSVVATSNADTTNFEENGHDPRYLIIGDKAKAYHLQIRKIQQSDAGIFYCSVHSKMSGEVILQSSDAKLEVLFPPDDSYPSCNTAGFLKYSGGDTLTTECISRGGNGPLRLSWLRSGKVINGTRIDDKNPDIRDTWTLTPAENGSNITCVMNGKAVLNMRQCVIGPLDVHFEVTVSIEPRTSQVSVGQSASFHCTANANPPITSYSWFLNENQLDHSTSHLTIDWSEVEEQATSDISEIKVTCSVNGANANVSDTATVNIRKNVTLISTAPQAVQNVPYTLIFYAEVGFSCFLFVVVVVLFIAYLWQGKKAKAIERHSSNNQSLDASCDFTSFRRCDIASGENTVHVDNVSDKRSNSSDINESPRQSGEESTFNDYESINEDQVDDVYQSIKSRSISMYMRLSKLIRKNHSENDIPHL